MTRHREDFEQTHAPRSLYPDRNGSTPAAEPSSAPSPIINNYVTTNGVKSPQRLKLLQIIQDQPGLNIRELTQYTQLTRSSTRYHLRRLIQAGKVVTERQGHHVLHFSAAMSKKRRKAVCLLRVASVFSLVEMVTTEGPVIRVSELANRLEISRRSARRSIKMLTKAELASDESVDAAKGARRITLSSEMRVAWVLWYKDDEKQDDKFDPLHKSPGWLFWLDVVFGSFFASWWS